MKQRIEMYIFEATMICAGASWNDVQSSFRRKINRDAYIRGIEEVHKHQIWTRQPKPEQQETGVISLGDPMRTPRRIDPFSEAPEGFTMFEQVDDYFADFLEEKNGFYMLENLSLIRNAIRNGSLRYLPSHQVNAVEFDVWWREVNLNTSQEPERIAGLNCLSELGRGKDTVKTADSELLDLYSRWPQSLKLAVGAWGKFWSDPTSEDFNRKRTHIEHYLQESGCTPNAAKAIQAIIRPTAYGKGGAKK